jgi:hypothetical protein
VRPQWAGLRASALRVHASVGGAEVFSLWRVVGRKQLTLRGRDLLLEAAHLAHRLHALLDPAIGDGSAIELSIPLDRQLRTRLSAYQAQAEILRGHRPAAQLHQVSRAGLLHLRALQALDGQQHGASHREIAEVLFGEEAVRARWSADGELRAQVRHLLSRANEFVSGGYLALAGIRKSAPTETVARGDSLPPGFAPVS